MCKVAQGGEIDQRSDIYAVGVMSFEMLTGELPKLTMASQLNPKLNSRVDEILAKSMASDPAQRYGNILNFIEDIEEAPKTRKVAPKAATAVLEGATVMEGAAKAALQLTRPTPKPESIVDMIMIPAGHFWMGSSLKEGKNDTEKPRHRVSGPPVTLTNTW